MEWIVVSLASLLAGFVDAIVGGGGLILTPALFAVFPTTHPATLFGTNKSASIWGTAAATWQFSRRVQIRWSTMLPAAAVGFAASFGGAWLVTIVAPDFLRKLLPGTGSFLVFLFVRWLGYDFLNASASAKLLNTATNFAALILFTLKGHVWWHYAVVLAVANVVGSVLGTRMALKHGTGFVRVVFIFVVSALILKTGYDAFLR